MYRGYRGKREIGDVKLIKDERRKREGKPPRDGEADWGVKNNGTAVGRDGEKGKQAQ